jgi:hypothetical protein
MPLPRLQIMGLSDQPVIYELHWDQRVQRKDVARYLSGGADTYDNSEQEPRLVASGVGRETLVAIDITLWRRIREEVRDEG